MASGQRKCRVCGREYKGCRTTRPDGKFHWQEVACSPECGTIYLQKITESRSVVEKQSGSKKSKRKNTGEMTPEVIDDVIFTDAESENKGYEIAE